jgi:hypothetical protein
VLMSGQPAHLITLDQLTQILTRQNNRNVHKEGGMNHGINLRIYVVKIITRLVVPDNYT